MTRSTAILLLSLGITLLAGQASALCFHTEDKADHKCFEACSEKGEKFSTKGIDQAGRCPAEYNTVDSTKHVRQCPDGVTNVKYCRSTAIEVVIKTKGEQGQDRNPVVPLNDTMTMLPPKNIFDKDVPNGCSKPGDCGRAYQACCAGFAAKGYPCNCHLEDGTGKSGSNCGTCGTGFSACCAGFAAKGYQCTCDIQ